MSQKNVDMRASDFILQAMALFSGVLLAVVLSYVLGDGKFYMNYSISRYMGREIWSAVAFALTNFILVWQMRRYVNVVWQKYGKIWLILMIAVMACFVGLSLCPLGLFDEVVGEYGLISILHQIFARLMFVMMALTVAVMGWKRRKEIKIFVPAIIYIIYAIVCAILSFTTQFFWDLNFILEVTYIYLFMIMLVL